MKKAFDLFVLNNVLCTLIYVRKAHVTELNCNFYICLRYNVHSDLVILKKEPQ